MGSVIDFSGTGDATSAVGRWLNGCSSGDTLRFQPGEYHFYPEFAYEQYYYISNNRHGLKRVAFPIIGKKNITIDGGGARFIFHGEIIPFVIESSEEITLKNFSIDWKRPFYSQGTVTAADQAGVTLEIDRAQYPYHFKDGQAIFEGEGWESGLTEGVFEINAETGAPAYLSGDSLGAGFPERLAMEDLGGGTIRLAESFPHLPKIGNILILRHYNRHCPGIHLKLSRNTLLKDITLYHAGGMGVIGQFCENVTVRNCKVTPAAGRIFSVMVDATHFVSCRGKILLEGSLFEGQLDDPCNIHGLNTRIKEISDRRSVITELVHYEQHGVEIGFPGDQVHFSDNVTLLSYAQNTIKKVEWINARYSRVIFEKDLPENLRPGHVIENMSWLPDAHIHGCTSRNNRARGYLISTPGKVIIEDNRIESSGAAIKISGDANYWFESGAVRDVIIRNNAFGDCCYGPEQWGRAVIDIDPEIADPFKNPECFHRNIRIEKNSFSTFDTGILFARSVDGITFTGNTIRRTETYPEIGRMGAALTFEACRHIAVEDNKADDSFRGEWMQEINSKKEVLV